MEEIDAEDRKIAIDRLLQLGNKFLGIAETEKLAAAAKAFYLAEKAFLLALKFEREMKPTFINPVVEFLKRIDSEIGRPEIWEFYLQFCQQYEVFPMGRNEFFSKLLLLGCKAYKKNGNFFISPPGNRRLLSSRNNSFDRNSEIPSITE